MQEPGGVPADPTGPAAAEAVGIGAIDSAIPERGLAAFVAEFVGTLGLVFFITMVVSLFVRPPISPAPGVAPPFTDWVLVGLVHAFALFMLIQALAVVSGAHFNPAVTVGLAVIRQIRWIDAAIYIALQLVGGVAGAALTRLIVSGSGAVVNWGAPEISQPFLNGGLVRGMLVEGIGTFFLVFAIVGVAVSPRAIKDWAGFVIGGTLGLIVMIGGVLTGGSYNPARAFGPALVAGHFGPASHFILAYLLAPLIGAALASTTYMYLFRAPGIKGLSGMKPVG